MRYFRRTSAGLPGCEYGVIKSENEFHNPPYKPFNGNEYWEEVTVTPKPQPKKFKKKIALFSTTELNPGQLFPRAYDEPTPTWPFNRETEWVEVEFTERSDKLSTDYKVVS